jgi:hypothetical protein
MRERGKPYWVENTKQHTWSRKFINLTGEHYGRWTVLKRAPNRGRYIYWKCQCECGTIKEISRCNLRNGVSQSCGCYNAEVVKEVDHGMSHTSEWNSWIAMKERCLNPNLHHYKDYGGRGITVCRRWLNSFQNFYDDMGPSGGLTIERIDVNGDYEPGNCKWIPRGDQARNKRSSRRIAALGEEKLFVDWSRELDLDPSLLHYHLEQGKTIEQIIEERKPKEKLCSCGKTYFTIKPTQKFCTDKCQADQRQRRRLKEKREREADQFMVVKGEGDLKRYVRGKRTRNDGDFKWIKSRMWAAIFDREDAEIVAYQMKDGATIEQRGVFIREQEYSTSK